MPRTYADNAYNRSAGRVGMTHGTAVISSGGGGGGASYGGGGYSSSSSSSRTYVDNASNRSLGRVGLPLGSAVHSTSSGGGGYSGYSSSSDLSSRTYVDNSSNRALGRVGLPLGSAVHSSGGGSCSYSSSSRCYVDNSMNRSLGRVGLPVGSAVHSSASGASVTSSSSASKTYVDNSLNRSLGRVGLSVGSAVNSSTSKSSSSGRVYVDNPYNQRLGRVGLPKGTAILSAIRESSSSAPSGARRYVDNPMNRRLGRVGKMIGTAPISSVVASQGPARCSVDDFFRPLERIDPEDNNLDDVMEQILRLRQDLLLNNGNNPDTVREQRCEAAIGIVNRHEAALTKYRSGLQTPSWVRGGQVIPFEELALGEKIGGGGFGDVFVGIWKEREQVAIKKLRVQRVSQAKKEQFQAEVKVFSQLDHPAIVKFFGVCIALPNLAIVMEFMAGGSMYDILHVEVRSLTTEHKENMITDCLSAMKYLHGKNVTHRDIKSMNIMICEDYTHCKLGDFGLALKEDGRSSASVADHSVVGTLVYSPPEVVQGKRLKMEELKCADIYSMSIVLVEFLTVTVPFRKMNQHQVRTAILEGQRPSVQPILDASLKSLLLRGMAANPAVRPSASEFFREWETCKLVGALDRLDIQPSNGGNSTTHLPSYLADIRDTAADPDSIARSTTSTRNSSSRSSLSRARCPVCIEKLSTHAFHCGHVVCDQCLPNLRLCPQCRGSVDGAIRIFL